MGWGDEIMVTADARRLQRQTRDPRKVAIADRGGLARWHEIWNGNPRLATPEEVAAGERVQWLYNYPGRRPYLDYQKFPRPDVYVYTDYRVEPGEIFLTDEERRLGEQLAGAIVVEPTIKQGAPLNKDWGFWRWRELVRCLAGKVELVQLGKSGTTRLPGVRPIKTPTYRAAAGALSGASVVLTAEGGLHHCAAALGIRAVVIFGGFISPRTTGYDFHVNLFTGGKACGRRSGSCLHCQIAMNAIKPHDVADAALGQLEAWTRNDRQPLLGSVVA